MAPVESPEALPAEASGVGPVHGPETAHPGAQPTAAVDSSAWAGAHPAVSVVVATRGRASFLAGLFETLAIQAPVPGGFEVVVVDDASTDRTWAVLADQVACTTLAVRALRLARNEGQGVARDVGTAEARGRVVAFTDDDCLPEPTWLARLAAPVLRATDAVVSQGRTEPWDGDRDAAGAWARTVWVLRPTWLFETCNVAYRRADLVAVGGFAGRGQAPVGPHGRLVGEDALTGWSVVEGGALLVFVPGALVHHRHHPATYGQFLAEQRGRGMFPALVERSPVGRLCLWRHWFLAPRTGGFDLMVVCLVIAGLRCRPGRRWSGLVWGVGAAPWLRAAWREAGDRAGRPRPVRLAQVALADAVGLTSLARGSLRWRALVL